MNFGNAGATEEVFGKNGQFRRTMLHPWRCVLNTESHLLPLLDNLFGKFTLMESCSMGGVHHATIIDNKEGIHFQIEIFPTHISVYPKAVISRHQAASERLFKIFERYGGMLDITGNTQKEQSVFACACGADDKGVCTYSGNCEYQSLPLVGNPPRQCCMVNEEFYWRYYG